MTKDIMKSVQVINKEGEPLTLNIMLDTMAENPRRTSDMLGTMICHHRKYDLGDKGTSESQSYLAENFNSWDDLKAAIIAGENPAVILPLFIYDHGGITMSVKQFSDHWDSGQVGFIFISKKKAREEYGRLTKKTLEKIESYLIAEVKEYDLFLQGSVYGFELIRKEKCNSCDHVSEESIDSCWGFVCESEDEMIKMVLEETGCKEA
jgi:hypothetical protein